jgi:hypothetical protein
MLTNFLPGAGNGPFKLHAVAYDTSGNTSELGAPGKTITCTNAAAAKPFGTIDTPGQGAIVSGAAYINFGWALTPGANFKIPIDGSTLFVVIDGVPGPHPVYNQFRSDIATLFPGFTNSGGAVGYYYLDTTKLTDGVHSISWNAYDNAARGEGLGSRYFTVANGTGNEPDGIGGQVRAVNSGIRKSSRVSLPRDAGGRYAVTAQQGERLELRLGAVHHGSPLPAGSTLDPETGVFYWQPIAPFLGDYDLTFTPDDPAAAPVHVRVTVTPQRFD